ncbi:unnamed protein product [Fraxinus pennsylvanica]|uniref:Uncharacterized protein n=1 Tax=Fraxinus pennsylvanica TaxID=56036 RepID=A0AAD1ZHL1_9LAMI|nr:unnamed protein product [Fraxinus pennsylvanica]
MRMNSCSTFAASMWLIFLAFSDVLVNAKYLDISHEYVPGLPKYDSPTGLGTFMKDSTSILKGEDFNTRNFNLSTDCGTHYWDFGNHQWTQVETDYDQSFVDHFPDDVSPEVLFVVGHSSGNYCGTHVKAFTDVESLDLTVLNGPALVVEVPKDKNITAEVMQSLNIPKGIKRVLFKTLNTQRKLMYKKEFDSSYTGFQKDGAEWLVENTDIKLIGLDYLSVAVKPDKDYVYQVLGKDVIPVEGCLRLTQLQRDAYLSGDLLGQDWLL